MNIRTTLLDARNPIPLTTLNIDEVSGDAIRFRERAASKGKHLSSKSVNAKLAMGGRRPIGAGRHGNDWLFFRIALVVEQLNDQIGRVAQIRLVVLTLVQTQLMDDVSANEISGDVAEASLNRWRRSNCLRYECVTGGDVLRSAGIEQVLPCVYLDDEHCC